MQQDEAPVAYLSQPELLAIVRRCASEGACRLDEAEAAWARWEAARRKAQEKTERWRRAAGASAQAAREARLIGEQQGFKGPAYEDASARAAAAQASAATLWRISQRAQANVRALDARRRRLDVR